MSHSLRPAQSTTSVLAAANMTVAPILDEMELAALISSKICHDIIGPVGAINNGIEVLDEDDEAQQRAFALEVIRNSTEVASAKLQFFRFAFGSAGSAGAMVDMANSEQIARGFVGNGKHRLSWKAAPGHMAKDKVKLLLNMIASGMTALPRGGEIVATVRGKIEDPAFEVRCIGAGARPPAYVREFIASPEGVRVDALSVQAYYTARLARATQLKLTVTMEGIDAVLSANR